MITEHPDSQEKSREYYEGLARKYRVNLDSFVSEEEQDRFFAIQHAFKRFSLSGLVSVVPECESTEEKQIAMSEDTDPRSQGSRAEILNIFAEIVELTRWLICTFPSVHQEWKNNILKVIRSQKALSKGKSDVLHIDIYQELFYFLHNDELFKSDAIDALLFPSRSILDMNLPGQNTRYAV